MNNYGQIATLLKTFLKNNSFVWNDATKEYFFALKEAMCTTLILEVFDFAGDFYFECDAS